MNKMTIYDINEDIYRLMNCDIDADDQEDAMAMLDKLLIDRDSKIENVGLCVKSFNSLAEAIKAEEQTLAKRRKALESSVERCKNYLAYALQSQGDTRFCTPKLALSFRQSTSVNITNEAIIPDEFKISEVVVKVSKTSLKEALKEGEIIAGAELVVSSNIQIK